MITLCNITWAFSDTIATVAIITSICCVFLTSHLENKAHYSHIIVDPKAVGDFYVNLQNVYTSFFVGKKANSQKAYIEFSKLLSQIRCSFFVLKFSKPKKYQQIIECLTNIDESLTKAKDTNIDVIQKDVDKELAHFYHLERSLFVV